METRRLELLQKMPVFGAIREDSLRLLLAQALPGWGWGDAGGDGHV